MASSPDTSSRRTLGLVFFTVFLDLVGFGIIIPIQPFFAETLGARPMTVTLLGASFSFMQFVFAPVWGRMSDRVGRRPVMLASVFITAVGYLLFGLAESLPALFAARMLAGLGSANIGTAQAIIADSTTGESRAKGMGLIGAAFGLGFILGPAIGGIAGQWGLAAPAFVAAFLSFGNLIFTLAFLPETYPPAARGRAKAITESFSIRALKHAARHPGVPQLFLLFLVYTVAFSMMEQSFGLFIEVTWLSDHGVDVAKRAAALTSYALIMVGVTATVIQGAAIGPLVRRFGENRLLVAGTTLVAISLFGMPVAGWVHSYPLFVAVCGITALGTGMLNPSINSLLSRAVDEDEQGGVLGVAQGLSGLGRVIGPAMAGVLFERWHGSPFWVGSGLVLICVAIALVVPPSRIRGSAR